MKKKSIKPFIDFQPYLEQQLKNPLFKKYYDEFGMQLDIAFKIHQLRKKQRMSQSELAKKIGTTQSNIARMEIGNQNFTIITLHKIAKAFKRELKVEFV